MGTKEVQKWSFWFAGGERLKVGSFTPAKNNWMLGASLQQFIVWSWDSGGFGGVYDVHIFITFH